jgi:mannose/cellobiose epimerase-like protein (N-acyl-D-glucosamine 2-epimerase family)
MPRLAACVALLVLLCLTAAAGVAPCAWLEHVEHDLAGFWMRDDLAGEPVGSFPTFICADGAPLDASDPCPSLANAGDWVRSEFGRQYIRMVSRQAYTYGVIYHLTGNESALDRARAGTRYIMDHAWDRETGSVATFVEGGELRPEPAQRTTQSLAYALVGPAFYYYLTRDPDVLAFIVSVRHHIFGRYWSDEWKMLRWTLDDFGDDTTDRKELVAQLDQINAYMLLMLPLLDEDARREWQADLRRTVDAMLRDFHDEDALRFYGYIHDEKGKAWGERHNDYGHTTKGYWMLYLAGRRTGEREWVDLGKAGILRNLARAFVRRDVADAPEWQAAVMRRAADAGGIYHVWANRPDGIGIAWWEWCELDQAAATMALIDPELSTYTDATYRTFFATLVDPVNGGTYGFPGAVSSAKGHHWQNGYHAAEHALVGYVTSAMQSGEAFRLYFAFPDSVQELAAPAYYFDAEESGRRAMERIDGRLRKVRVTYESPASRSSRQ